MLCAVVGGISLGGQSRPASEVDVRGIVVVLDDSGDAESARESLQRSGGTRGEPEADAVRLALPPDARTLGHAWQRAYEAAYQAGPGDVLQKKPGVAYALPSVTHAPDEGEEISDRVCPPCDPVAIKRSKCNNPVPGALQDPEWSLDGTHGANVLAAHEMFARAAAANGPPAGPGAGVVVGHPDTGYRKHPEIWPGIDAASGWDFLGDRDDPEDPLLTGTLRNPGHGTKTASVIVSSKESRLTPTRWVTGVAPGATLMPLRVVEGVLMFHDDLLKLQVNSSRLADAIRAASGPNRHKAKKHADVISISLGSLPGTRDLADAIAYAESRGVIVIAAAGNQVPGRRVVFPAAYPTAVAVAATNYDSKVWECSSRGRRVVISAPGESVWTAAAPGGQSCVQASTGTSFATATIAGVAALWLSYPDREHQRELAQLRGDAARGEQNRIPRAFREVLSRAYRRPAAWDPSALGPGIVDAVKVLERPSVLIGAEAFGRLVDRTRVEAAREDWCPTDPGAFAGLRGIFSEASDPRERVEALLGPDLCATAVVADEIAMLYTVDSRVTDAVLRISGRETPAASEYARARAAIRRADVSPQLQRLVR